MLDCQHASRLACLRVIQLYFNHACRLNSNPHAFLRSLQASLQLCLQAVRQSGLLVHFLNCQSAIGEVAFLETLDRHNQCLRQFNMVAIELLMGTGSNLPWYPVFASLGSRYYSPFNPGSLRSELPSSPVYFQSPRVLPEFRLIVSPFSPGTHQ